MFRTLCAILAMSAFGAVATAQAQPRACEQVDVSFACRNGGSGSTGLACRNGETEAQCCTRHRGRAADPRRGWCTGRNGGLKSFECACPREGAAEEPGQEPAPRRLLPRTPDAEPAQPDKPEKIKAGPIKSRKKGQAGDAEPPCVDRFGGKVRRDCLRVSVRYFCKGRLGGSKAFGCAKGQSQADCCRTVMAGLCRHSGLDRAKTGKIQRACRCVKWSKWQKCKPVRPGQRR